MRQRRLVLFMKIGKIDLKHQGLHISLDLRLHSLNFHSAATWMCITFGLKILCVPKILLLAKLSGILAFMVLHSLASVKYTENLLGFVK